VVLAAPGCGPCGEGEYFWQHISGRFSDLVVSGQGELYSASPTQSLGYTIDAEDSQWKVHLDFIRDPTTSAEVLYGGTAFGVLEPWCNDGNPDLILGCGRVSVSQTIAGPKNMGEVYQVQHFDIFPSPAAPPAMYLEWKEDKYYEGLGDFPQYHSISVTGTAEVTAEHPFQMTFDVHFLDADGNPRDVKWSFHYEYWEGCGIEN